MSPTLFRNIVLFFLIALSNYAYSQTVYVTKSGEKYHKDGCQYLSKSKIETTLSEALKNGYDACKVCKPENKSSTSVNTLETPTPQKSTQCSALTKTGSRCKRMTKNANGKCFQHQ